MPQKRPSKVIRLNYRMNAPSVKMASVTIFGSPAEVRMASSKDNFISVKDATGVSLSPGLGKQVNIQALPHNMRYGGMLMDLPFPLSIIPVTPFTPFPNQLFVPPMLGLIPTLIQISAMLALFPA